MKNSKSKLIKSHKEKIKGKDKLGGYLVEGETWMTEILCGKEKFIVSNASRSTI